MREKCGNTGTFDSIILSALLKHDMFHFGAIIIFRFYEANAIHMDNP